MEHEPTSLCFDPVPRNPEAAIATLDTRTLVGLSDILQQSQLARADNPWLQVITTERSRRSSSTRSVGALEKYHPSEVESPEYDYEAGPAAYLELARTVNRTANIAPEKIGKEMAESSLMSAMVRAYILSKTSENNGDAVGSSAKVNLMNTFEANARGILLGPLSAASLSYKSEKDKAIRSYIGTLSGVRGNTLRYQLHGLKKDRLEELRMTIEDVPYRSLVPDFYSIRRDYQDAVLGTIFSKCMEMHEFIDSIDPGLLSAETNRSQMPLAYHSIAELEQAIEMNPLLNPGEVCAIFVKQPQSFQEVLAGANKRATTIQQFKVWSAQNALDKAEKKAAQRQQLEKWTAQRATESKGSVDALYPAEHSLTDQAPRFDLPNIDAIQRLVDDLEVNEAILDAEAGALTAITEQGSSISAHKFDRLVGKHVELIGRALWENMEDRSSIGLRLIHWNKFDVGKSLRGKFNGNMRDVKIAHLPVTEEELEKALNNYAPDKTPAKSALRLLVEAEMKPTGKHAQSVHLDMLLLIHKAKGRGTARDALHKSRQGLHTTGSAMAKQFEKESKTIGQIVEGAALMRPLRAGLPGLGKKR